MNAKGKKLEPKLGLDMPFGELLERLVKTKPTEVEASIERAKQKRPATTPKRLKSRTKIKRPAKRSAHGPKSKSL
jgi:hypothetical protein